jgi:hypothetical protein
MAAYMQSSYEIKAVENFEQEKELSKHGRRK